MRLFTPLAIKATLILFFYGTDGFMFNAWLRSTTERNLPTLGQYKYQSYANNDAQTGGMAPAVASGYESKKDFGKPNVEAAVVTPPRAFYGPNDKDTVAAYNNQRTGISAPPKYDKPWNLLDAVVVHSIPSAAAVPSSPITYVAIPAQHYPYFYYGDNVAKVQQAQNVSSFTTTLAPQKSVQVELNYRDATVVEKIGENAVLNRKISANPAESVQTTSDSSALASDTGTGTGASATTFAVSPPVSIQRQNSTSSSAPESSASAKRNLQNRPIKLLGSSTFYTSPANFTFTPQLFYASAPVPVPVSDIQYVPYPFLKSPLITPFLYKSVPPAVSDRSENLPLSPTPQAAFQSTSNKSAKPICDNCLVHPNFPTYPHVSKIFDANDNAFQKPCAQENASNSPTPFALKSSNLANLAYVLVPSQVIKHHPSRKR